MPRRITPAAVTETDLAFSIVKARRFHSMVMDDPLYPIYYQAAGFVVLA